MKKVFYLLISMLVLCLTACDTNQQSSDTTDQVQYVPFLDASNHKWGMMTPEGKVLFGGRFDQIPSFAINDRFIISDGSGEDGEYDGTYFYIYTAEQEPRLVAGPFINRVVFTGPTAVAAIDNSHPLQLIDNNGKCVKEIGPYDGHMVFQCSQFIDGYAVFVTDERLSGVINHEGDVIIKPTYAGLYNIGQGRFLVYRGEPTEEPDEEDLHQPLDIIDIKEHKLGAIKPEAINAVFSSFGNGLFSEPVQCGHLVFNAYNSSNEDQSGSLQIYDFMGNNSREVGIMGVEIANVTRSRIIVTDFNDNTSRVVRMDGAVLVDAGSDEIRYMNDERYWRGNEDNGFLLIDSVGDVVSSTRYTDVYPSFNGTTAIAKTDEGRWVSVKSDGTESPIAAKIERIAYNETINQDIIETYFDPDLTEKVLKLSCQIPNKAMKTVGDLPAFDLRGPVKNAKITFNGNTKTWGFNATGKLVSVNDRAIKDAFLSDRREIIPRWPEPTKEEHLVFLEGANGSEMMGFGYSSNGILDNCYLCTDEGVTDFHYVCNNNGYQLYAVQPTGDNNVYTYSEKFLYIYRSFDNQGNWTRRTVHSTWLDEGRNDATPEYEETREITYY